MIPRLTKISKNCRSIINGNNTVFFRRLHTGSLTGLLNDPTLITNSSSFYTPSSSSSLPPLPVYNPSSGLLLGEVVNNTAEEVSATVDELYNEHTSSSASSSSWSSMHPSSRGSILSRYASLLTQHANDLAHIMTLEQGKPLAEARGEVDYALGFLTHYSGECTRIYGAHIPSNNANTRIITLKQPIGLVAAITPWNFPLAMITRKIGAALAAGCPVILKPSEFTPFSAVAAHELAMRAGIPNKAFRLVTGDATKIGAVLTQHPAIKKITFTGSTRVGKLLLSSSASTVKRLSLELGGNAPFIIFGDVASIDDAVTGVILSKFRNAGQTCVCANRIFVQEQVYDAFIQKLTERVKTLTVGDGRTPGVQIGPLINENACKKVEAHIADALAHGATLVHGMKTRFKPKEGMTDLFFAPTIVKDATPEMLCFRDETFGPVAFIYKFSGDEEVIKMANNTEVGLAAYVYTSSVRRQFTVMERLEYGMVALNVGSVSSVYAPFGGVKESGMGREGGNTPLDDFTVIKTAHFGL